ncbi:hypothetical protein N431DRAFT_28366 [Stipitochalara longipes BDJ]|nr:hypothetical protein N431DRAFT_28366 [Stipitochalara longipes BDJ]
MVNSAHPPNSSHPSFFSLDGDANHRQNPTPSPPVTRSRLKKGFVSPQNLYPTPTPTPTPPPRNPTPNQVAAPARPRNTHFTCPLCPRRFSTHTKAKHHIQTYRHTHFCLVPGCAWNYELHKDLVRHSTRHNPTANRFLCPALGCGISVSRADLLPRHVERFHQ